MIGTGKSSLHGYYSNLKNQKEETKEIEEPWLGPRLEHHPIHQKATGWIPSQSTDLGCKFNPQSGCIQEAAN